MKRNRLNSISQKKEVYKQIIIEHDGDSDVLGEEDSQRS